MACKAQLERQKQQITSSPLHRKARDLDSVHVPLGLVERKERPKVDRTQEISPERGSEVYQQGYTETKRVEHDAFLTAIGQRQPGEHVVILGEPGAGKTTLLTKVWEWLLEQPGEDIIVAWVSLAAVKSNELEEYLRKSWLKQFCKSGDIDRYWASFEALADAGRVWLLLDGADEMGGEALGKIETTLGEVWARSMRAIVTCRLNLWDAGSTNKLQTSSNFQVYRTLDFKYMNPAGRDEVKEFIDNWFRSRSVSEGASTPAAGLKLRAALDEVGKGRIKDLAQNPLRLTLLCAFWEEGQALPETQAGLYELFVDYVYDWKAAEFSEAVKLRGELDRALGVLAKQGINKPSLRFRFTEAELRKWVPVVEQCQALMALGWLNCVGEENQRPVFAFFHPTFQEYFAACSIDDWDYFLPRAHVDQPVACLGEEEIGATYRVFELEWRQPMLLWFGRKNIQSEAKEKFIEKLMDFQEQEEAFYANRAFFIVAIFIGEFKYSTRSREIVDKCIEGAFGYFNTENQDWINYLEPIQSLAIETIPFTHREYAIDYLEELLDQLDQPSLDHIRYRVALALGRIDIGNESATDTLITFLQQPNLDNWMQWNIEVDLEKIAIFIGNQKVVGTIIALLQKTNLDKSVLSRSIRFLGKVTSINLNQKAIDTLMTFLQQENPGSPILYHIIEALGKVAVGNQSAINIAIALLQKSSSKEYEYEDLVGKIAVGNQIAVDSLVKFVLQPRLNMDRLRGMRSLIEIAVGDHEQKAIDALVTLLNQPYLDSSIQFSATAGLGRISVGSQKQKAINTLVTLINQPNLDANTRSECAFTLRKIAVGNQKAINTLTIFLNQLNPDDNLRYNSAFVLGMIAIGYQRQIAIDILEALLKQPTLDSLLRFHVIFALGEIDVDNQTAIDALVTFQPKDKAHQYAVIKALGKIIGGNQIAINALVSILQQPNIYQVHQYRVVEALGETADGSQIAINALVALLQQHDLCEPLLLSKALEALGKIAGGNPTAIDALMILLQQHDLNNRVRDEVEKLLEKILTKKTMLDLVWRLKKSVNNVTDEEYNYNFKVYNSCFRVLFHCAQILPYPDFHVAWHLSISTQISFISLDLFDCSHVIHITNFNNYNTPNDITTELSIRIHQHLAITPIPETPTISQLKRQLLNHQLSPHLVLILENPNPTATLITEITKLHTPKQIQILWLTDAPIPNAFPPTQPNLASVIQEAIDRFTAT